MSSRPGLAAEREAIGQVVAEMPVSLGWEIKHTLRMEEDAHEPLAFIARSNLCVTALEADFATSMGVQRLDGPL